MVGKLLSRLLTRHVLNRWALFAVLFAVGTSCSKTDFVLGNSPGIIISPNSSSLVVDNPVVAADGVSYATVKVMVRTVGNVPRIGQKVQLVSSRGANDQVVTMEGTTDAAGVATFRILSTLAGVPTLFASVGSTVIANAAKFTFVPAAAAKLSFIAQPSATATAGFALVSQPSVVVLDASNNKVSNSTVPVNLAVYHDASCSVAASQTLNGSASLAGVFNLSASGGLASFSGIKANLAGTVYLQASSPGLTPSCSQAIQVSPGAYSLADSILSSSASTVFSGSTLTLTFTSRDAFGNTNPTGVTSVSVSKSSGAGAGTFGTVTNLGFGVFSSVFTAQSAGVLVIASAMNGSPALSSQSVTVLSGSATKLAFTTPPSGTTNAGLALSQQPVVSVEDAFGNVVPNAGNSITLAAYSDSGCSVPVSTTPNSSATLSGTTTLAASSGVASFSGIKANRAGAVYLKASTSGLSSACSSLVTVSPGVFSLADSAVSSSAGTVVSGSSITITLTGKDAYGNTAPSGMTTVTFASTAVGGTGSFGSVTNAGSGVYTSPFTGQVAGLVTLSSTINAGNVTSTQNVTVTNGTATKLAFTTQPSTTSTAGSAISQQPSVSVEDAAGNLVSSASNTIVLAAYSDSGCSTTPIATTPNSSSTLTGTTSLAATSGVASYSGITANRAGTVYLQASTSGLTSTCSAIITVSPTGFSLADSAMSSSAGIVNSGSSVTITLTGKDSFGNLSPSGMTTIVFSKASGAGDGSFGSVTNAGSGVYTTPFTGTTGGLVTIQSTINASTVTSTQNVTVNSGTATKLVFTTQPTSTSTAGAAITQQPVVSIEDASNNVVSSATNTIVLAAYSDSGCSTTPIATTSNSSSTLTGTTSLAATSGVASYSGITANRAGAVYIQASTSGLTSACSSLITVSPAAFSLADSAVTSSSGTVASGSSITITLTGKDAYGNLSPSGMTTVTFASTAVGGTGSFGSVTNAGSGVYTSPFTGQVAGLTTISSTINAGNVTSTQNVTVTNGAATKLVFTTQPTSTATAGVAITQQPVVSIEDASNNVVTGASNTIVLAAYSDSGCSTTPIATTPNSSSTLTGTTSLAASSGVASYTDVKANRAGTVYVQASTSGLTSACSAIITVSPTGFSLADSAMSSSAGTVNSGSSVTITLTGKDSFGNLSPTGMTTIVFSKASGAGDGTFGSVTNAGSGVYTTPFTGTAGGLVTIQSTINSGTVTSTQNVTVNPGTATKLVFTTQPTSAATAGVAITQQPVVSIEDASNNVVSSATNTIVLAAYSDSGCSTTPIATTPNSSSTLSGTTSLAATSGVASYSGVKANYAGAVYIQASTSGLTSACSSLITVSPTGFSLADSAVSSSAGTVNSGSSVTITLTGKDSFGNLSPSGMTTVVFSKASGAGDGTFGSVTNAGSGVYTTPFTGTTGGLVTIQSTINSGTVTSTQNVTVNPGTATKLVFTTQPTSTATAGVAITQQPVVSVEDASNNVVTGASNTIVLAAYSDSGCSTTPIATTPNSSSTLTGTTSLAATSGVASYSGIKANLAGSVYIQASTSGLTSACSSLITVSPAAFSLADSAVTSSAGTVASGSSITITLTGKDAYGNLSPSGMTTVTFASTAVGGTGSFGSVTNAGSGVYTSPFTGQVAGLTTISSTINAGNVTSTQNVTVTNGAATKLVFTTQPTSTSTAGAGITQQPVVSIEDASSNVVTGASNTIVLAAYSDSGCSTTPIATTPNSSNTLTGTISLAASSGVATYTNVKANRAGTVYLQASTSGLTSTCSAIITVSPTGFSLADSAMSSSAGTVNSGSSVTITLTGKDSYGNLSPSGMTTIVFSKASGAGDGSFGSVTNAGSGVYTTPFTGTTGGLVTIQSTINASTVTSTQNVTVNSGTATKLVFTTQPTSTSTAGAAITQQPVVSIEDASNNVVSSATNTIVLAAYSDSGCSTTPIATTPNSSSTLSGTTSLAATSGVASYSGVKANYAGAVYIQASTSGLTSACSSLITVSPTGFSLADSAMSSSAGTVNSGSSVTITLTGKDSFGNLSPTGMTTIVFSKASGAGDGSFGSVTNAGSGVYTTPFTGTTGGLVTIQSTINAGTVTSTQNVTVNPGTATKLVFTTQPTSTSTAGATITQQPVVSVEDASNNVVIGASNTIVLAAYSDSGCSTTAIATTPNSSSTLTGTTSLAASSGVATYTNVKANRAGTVYLQASTSGLTSACSAIITVAPTGFSLADSAMSSSAGTVNSGSSVTITLTGKDSFGNLSPSGMTTVVFSKASGAGDGTFGSVTNAGSGVYTTPFTGTTVGLATIQSTINSGTVTSTQNVTVNAGTATKLVFTTQPTSTSTAGVAITQQPVVSIEDASNNVVTSATNTIVLAAYSDSGCSTTPIATTPNSSSNLSGTTSLAATSGVASYSGITANRAGAVYIQASTSGLTSACSSLITVSPAAFSLADSAVTSSSGTVASGSSITITLTGKDAYGNLSPSGMTTVVFSSTAVGGTGSFGSVTNAGSGVYTSPFTGQVAGLTTISSTINAGNVTSTQNVTVTNGAATKLVFTTQPTSTSTAGAAITQQPVVSVEDASSNVVTGASNTIVLAAYSDSGCSTTPIATTPNSSSTLTGTTSLAASSGVATYTNVKANRAGTVYLQATTSGLTSACSAIITVSPTAFSLADSAMSSSAGTVNSGSSVTITLTGKDSFGNLSPTGMTTIVFSKASGAGDGSFGSVTNAGSGVYTTPFTGTTGGLVTIQSTINAGTVTSTQNVTVNAGAATKLVFTTQPTSTATAGVAITQQPVVSIEDASNNVVTGASNTIVLAAYSDSGCSTTPIATTPNSLSTLTGTTSLAATSGVATYTNVKANRAGAVYIQASTSGLTSACTSLVTVSPAAFSLADSAVTSSSGTVASGSSITITLTGKDAFGNLSPTGMTTVTFASTSVGGTGSFGSVTNAGSGVYTSPFTGQVAGLTTISSTINAGNVTSTQNVTVTNGTITKLVFTTAPSTTGNTDSALSQQPSVSAEDAASNVVTSYTSPITFSAYSDTSCASPVASSLSASANPVTAVSGVATTSSLKILKTNVQSLKATDGTYSVCYATLTISPGVPSVLSISSGNSPTQTASPYTALGLPFVVLLKDANANIIPSFQINWAVTAGGGTLGSGASVSTDTSGLSSNTLTTGTAGSQTVTATVNGYPAITQTFTATATTSPFTNSWTFDAAQTSSYSYNTSKLEFVGGVCRLTASDQLDDDNSASGFGGGTLSGAAYDATNSYVRLTQTGTPTNTAELDSSWTPKWANLLSYWKMNNDWNDSIGTLNGSAQSSPTFTAAARLGSAAGTFSSGAYVSLPSYNGTWNQFTIMAWVNPSAALGITLISTDHLTFRVGSNSNTIGIVSDSGTVPNIDAGPAPVVNAWQQVAITWDGTTLKAYGNGSWIKSNTGSGALSVNAIQIARNITSIGSPDVWQGSIDDLAIWTTALSASDIQTVYSRQSAKYSGTLTSRVMDALQTGMSWTTFSWVPTLPFMKNLPDYSGGTVQNENSTDYPAIVGSTGTIGDNNLMSGNVALWHLDEPAGVSGAGSVIDNSGTGTHATPSGTVTFGGASPLKTGANFSGTTGLLTVPNGYTNTIKGAESHTISFWMRAADITGADRYIMHAKDLPGGSGYYIDFDQGKFIWGIGSGFRNYYGSTINLNQWYHIALVKNGVGDNAAFYINGVARTAFSSGAFSNTPNLSSDLLIGASSSGAPSNFLGDLDEFAIWNRALDPKEIQQLYRRGVNRIKHQVRICTAADCSDDANGANWKGPDGTNQTYFSELNNNTVPLATTGSTKKTGPSMLFSAFTSPVGTSRYFQYRTILESDDTGTGCDYGSGATWCSPELKSVKVDPVHYDNSAPTVIGKTGASYYSLTNVIETLGSSCAGGIGYNLGVGASYSTATWYWWDTSANSNTGGWVVANGTVAQSTSASTAASNIAAFRTQVGSGTVFFKAYLKSSGTTACELDNLEIDGQN